MSSTKKTILLAVSIIIAGCAIGGAIFYVGYYKSQLTANLAEQVPPLPPSESDIPSRIVINTSGHPFIGKEDAPITIVEINDYQCPFCKKFALEIFPQLKKEYIDTGKVKFVFRDFPLPYHPDSQKAAEAALCYYRQNLDYSKIYTKLFENSDDLTIKKIKEEAKSLGAKQDEFNQCLDNGQFAEDVKTSFEEINQVIQSSKLKNFGTPAFFINGTPLIGAQPLSAFKQIIDEKLGADIKN